MVMEIKVVNAQQQTTTMALANGSNLGVAHGDTIRLLSKENFQTVRKGNDLIIKNAKGEEFVLKDFYVKAQNADETQLLSWDDELNQEKALFSADSSEQIKLAEVDAGTVNDATPGGQEVSAANSGGAVTAGAGGISTGMAMAGIGALAVGGVAVAASGGGNSSDKNTGSPAMTKVNEAPIITSGDSGTVAENTTGVVYQAAATDADGDNITYSLSGTDADWFNIDAQTGAVSFKNAPDYEAIHPASVDNPPNGMVYVRASSWDNTYDINIIATDGKLSTQKAVIVTVINVDEAPTVTTNSGVTAFTEAKDTPSTAVVIDRGITVTDVDSSTLATATVIISTGYLAHQDVLLFQNNQTGAMGVSLVTLTASQAFYHCNQ